MIEQSREFGPDSHVGAIWTSGPNFDAEPGASGLAESAALLTCNRGKQHTVMFMQIVRGAYRILAAEPDTTRVLGRAPKGRAILGHVRYFQHS